MHRALERCSEADARSLVGGLRAGACDSAGGAGGSGGFGEGDPRADPVPYMGWNTYYGVGGVFNEATIKSVAESLISSGLAQAGYKIVWLDFGWGTGARDGSGNLIVDSTQWPDGMSGLTSWLHAQGLGGYLHRRGHQRLQWTGGGVVRPLPAGRRPVRGLGV